MTASDDVHRPGVPEGMSERDLDQRAELAGFLGKEVWPATGARLREVAGEHSAPDSVRGRLSQLPADKTYASLSQVWEELSGHKEQHRF